MDEKFRGSMMEVYEHFKSKVMAEDDPERAAKVMTAYKMSADLILKHDAAADSHDENVEKIINAQANEEKRLEFERMKTEQDISASEAKIELEGEKLESEVETSRLKIDLDREKFEAETSENEKRAEAEAKRFKKEFMKDCVKIGITGVATIGTVVFACVFDGKGVIFTSTAGKQAVSSAVRKLTDTLKF